MMAEILHDHWLSHNRKLMPMANDPRLKAGLNTRPAFVGVG